MIEDQHLVRRDRTSTPVYVYGVVRAGAAAPDTRGILDLPVDVVGHRSVAALVTAVDERVRAKRRDLLAHSDVLQEAFTADVVLPLRFGTLFRDEDDLVESFLQPRHDELRSLLDRYKGVAELRVKATYHDEQSVLTAVVADEPAILRLREETRGAPAGDPRLVALGELVASRLQARRAADADDLVRRLAPHAQEVHDDAPDDELTVVKVSFLVRDGDRRAFDAALDSAALVSRHLMQLSCIGPLPPHSFVSLGEGRS